MRGHIWDRIVDLHQVRMGSETISKKLSDNGAPPGAICKILPNKVEGDNKNRKHEM